VSASEQIFHSSALLEIMLATTQCHLFLTNTVVTHWGHNVQLLVQYLLTGSLDSARAYPQALFRQATLLIYSKTQLLLAVVNRYTVKPKLLRLFQNFHHTNRPLVLHVCAVLGILRSMSSHRLEPGETIVLQHPAQLRSELAGFLEQKA
jgi:hypothetical protein